MKLYFYGADKEVTGSCHCLELGGKRILFDCGLQQGGDTKDNGALPFAAGEIDLGRVTGHDELGVHAHSGEEHLELGQIRVLCLVQDDTCPVQRPASHVGQRGDLDRSLLDELLQSLGWNHVAESVVQWLEVRIQLVFQVSGQESQPFTGLDGRTGQDDPLYLTVFQRPDSQSDRYVGLAGAGRADGKDEVVLEIGLSR